MYALRQGGGRRRRRLALILTGDRDMFQCAGERDHDPAPARAAGGAGRDGRRRRSRSATASRPPPCPTSSRCAATRPTACPARRGSARRRPPTCCAATGRSRRAIAGARCREKPSVPARADRAGRRAAAVQGHRDAARRRRGAPARPRDRRRAAAPPRRASSAWSGSRCGWRRCSAGAREAGHPCVGLTAGTALRCDRLCRRFPVPPQLEAHYQMVLRALVEGRVIPLLGAGRESLRPPRRGRAGTTAATLPDGGELVALPRDQYAAYPEPDTGGPRARVPVRRGDARRRAALRRAARACSTSTTRRRRCTGSSPRCPAALRAPRAPARHRLIVTTNYDDALERAFAAAGEPFDLVELHRRRRARRAASCTARPTASRGPDRGAERVPGARRSTSAR